MDKRDNSEIVASSLTAVIRQSLNAPFRRECLLLLGVTNMRDAAKKINEILLSKEIRNDNRHNDVKETVPLEIVQVVETNNSKPIASEMLKSTAESSLPDPNMILSFTTPSTVEQNVHSGQKLQSGDNHSDEEALLDWDVEPTRTN